MFSSMWVGEEGQDAGRPIPAPVPAPVEQSETSDEQAHAVAPPPGQVTTLACGEEGHQCSGLPHPFSLFKPGNEKP